MSADIVERLEYARTQLEDDVLDFLYLQGGNDSKRYKTAQAINVLLREAAAEIVRLRGEVDRGRPKRVVSASELARLIRATFDHSGARVEHGYHPAIAPAEAKNKWAPPYPDAAKDPFNALLTTPPAPVQAAPQVQVNPCKCIDCGGDEPRHSSDCTYMADLHGEAAHPSACELGAWNDAIEAAASEAEHWQARSGSTHKCGDYIAGAIRSMKRAALQHRGDSRGGES